MARRTCALGAIVALLVVGLCVATSPVAPDSAAGLYASGLVSATAGELAAAELDWRFALEVLADERAGASADPTALDALEYRLCLDYAFVLTKVHRAGDAYPLAKRALALNDSADARFSLGIVAKTLESWAEAVEHLRVGLAREPTRVRASYFLGEALVGLGEWSAAAAAFGTAYRAQRDRGALDQMGLALRAAGRADDERALYAEALASGLISHLAQRPRVLTPGLVSHDGFWTEAELPLLAQLNAGMPAVVTEFAAHWASVQDAGLPSPVGASQFSHDRALYARSNGSWTELALWETGVAQPAAYSFPATVQLVFDVARDALNFGRVIFSALAPGVKLAPHCGPTNERLTVHCGVRVPSGPGAADMHIRVGAHSRSWRQGECFAFDDSFEHEVLMPESAEHERVIVLFHIPHPQLAAVRAARAADPATRAHGADPLAAAAAERLERALADKAKREL